MNKINRRTFLNYAAASSFSLTTGINLTACTSEKITSDEFIIGGYSRTDNSGKRLKEYGVLAIQVINNTEHSPKSYTTLGDFSVPDEVHLATLSPDQKSILVCSRKPGASLLKYSLTGDLIAELKPVKNQYFEGHGIFSADEKYLYVTASDYQQGQGKLLKLNSLDLSVIEEYESGGIGPHELVWQSDNIIAVANTGVLTHPDSGRKILNLENIQSNIALFDTQLKRINHQWKVPLAGLSARHLDRMDNGDLVIGCQYKKEDQRPACIAFARRNKDLFFADQENEVLHWDMKGYTASIKSIPNTNHALISNPRGHKLTQWQGLKPLNIDSKLPTQLVHSSTIEFNKGIKVSRSGKQVWISKGAGELLFFQSEKNQLDKNVVKIKKNIWWANHLG